jgi:uncharacterized cupin superfamily protein
MKRRLPQVVNVADAAEIDHREGRHWGGTYKVLTPAMGRPGRLGVNLTRVPPGRTVCPFHAHQREDEAFYVLSGRGVLRYGDALEEIGPGDCIACPARSGSAHQIANPFAEDLVYLAIGPNDPDEVCVYPDSGKIQVRSIRRLGYLREEGYMHGEPDRPRIFELIEKAPKRRKKKS